MTPKKRRFIQSTKTKRTLQSQLLKKALINEDAFASADDDLDDDFDYGEDEDDEYESEEFLNDNDILKTFEE